MIVFFPFCGRWAVIVLISIHNGEYNKSEISLIRHVPKIYFSYICVEYSIIIYIHDIFAGSFPIIFSILLKICDLKCCSAVVYSSITETAHYISFSHSNEGVPLELTCH